MTRTGVRDPDFLVLPCSMFPLALLPGHYRVIDETLLAETT